jgi:hypothetical protein
MKKALKHVKHVFSSSSSSRNTDSHYWQHAARLVQSSSFVPSWRRAVHLSYNPAQTRGSKIVDDDDISIYTPEELERVESL